MISIETTMDELTRPTLLPEWFIRHFPRMAKRWFRLPDWFHQAIKFGLVGALNTGVDLSAYWLLTRGTVILAGAPVTAKAISYTLGVINSFFWNRNFTFHSQQKSPGLFFLFFGINLLAVGVNSGIMALAVHQLLLPEWYGLLLATAITMLWNFFTSKFIVFR